MKKTLTTILSAAAIALIALPSVIAQTERYVENVHYRWLPVDVKVDPTSTKPGEVVEFFSYGCPHCNDFFPHIEKWRENQPVNVNYIESPVSYGREDWGVLAMAKHIADKLDLPHDFQEFIFNAVHNQRMPFRNFEELEVIFVNYGVDSEAYWQAAESLQVRAALKKSEQNAKRYAITAVPSVMVNGHWMVNSQNLASFDEVFDVVEFLLKKDGIDISERQSAYAGVELLETDTVDVVSEAATATVTQ